jgi:hypothetical protein
MQATTTASRPSPMLQRAGTSPGPDRVFLRAKFPGSARRPPVAAFRRHARGGRTTHPFDGEDLAFSRGEPSPQGGRVVGPPARPKPLRRGEGPDCAFRRHSVRSHRSDQNVAGLRTALGNARHAKRNGPRSLTADADEPKTCAFRAGSDGEVSTLSPRAVLGAGRGVAKAGAAFAARS